MRRLRYEQASGRILLRTGDYFAPLGFGYAGHSGGLNNPDAQCIKSYGPLPRGLYGMRVVSHITYAEPAIHLLPHKSNDMCGRSGFYIHGDNAKGDHSASTGCIVADRALRSLIADLLPHGFSDLEVVL